MRVAHRRRRNAFWEDFATANDNFCLERRFGFGHTIHHHTMQKHFYSGGLPLVRQFSGLGDSWESAQVQVPQQGRIAHRPPAVVDLLQDRALQYERFGSCFSDHDGLCTAVHCCALLCTSHLALPGSAGSQLNVWSWAPLSEFNKATCCKVSLKCARDCSFRCYAPFFLHQVYVKPRPLMQLQLG